MGAESGGREWGQGVGGREWAQGVGGFQEAVMCDVGSLEVLIVELKEPLRYHGLDGCYRSYEKKDLKVFWAMLM